MLEKVFKIFQVTAASHQPGVSVIRSARCAWGAGHRPSRCTKYRIPRVSGETIKSLFFVFFLFFFFAQPTPADEAHAEEKAFVPLALPERKTWAEFKTTLE